MPPTIYLIRHGQGEHNINNANHLRDPLLTDLGKQQCQDLRDEFPFHENVSIVMASPLKRAIQTAAYTFAPTLEQRQLPFQLIPLAQEVSGLRCDLGDSEDVVKAGAPGLIASAAPGYIIENLDMTLVEGDWNTKRGIYAPTLNAVKTRAAKLRSWLWSRPEEGIAIVSHGGFMHYFAEDWTGYEKLRGTGYQNCEYRRFQFTGDSNESEAHLFEIGSMHEKQARPPGLDAHVVREIEEVEARADE